MGVRYREVADLLAGFCIRAPSDSCPNRPAHGVLGIGHDDYRRPDDRRTGTGHHHTR